MGAVIADTHAILWYVLEPGRLSQEANRAFDQAATAGDPIYVSAISLVETVYLAEKGKLPATVIERLTTVLDGADAEIHVVPITSEVAFAIRQVPRDAVPDMPDRIIAATALCLDLPLVTRDRRIQTASITTIW